MLLKHSFFVSMKTDLRNLFFGKFQVKSVAHYLKMITINKKLKKTNPFSDSFPSNRKPVIVNQNAFTEMQFFIHASDTSVKTIHNNLSAFIAADKAS